MFDARNYELRHADPDSYDGNNFILDGVLIYHDYDSGQGYTAGNARVIEDVSAGGEGKIFGEASYRIVQICTDNYSCYAYYLDPSPLGPQMLSWEPTGRFASREEALREIADRLLCYIVKLRRAQQLELQSWLDFNADLRFDGPPPDFLDD